MKELFARNDGQLQKIELNEVFYFTKIDGKVFAILKDSRYELTVSLYYLSDILSKNPNFYRCHKSFIVNLNKINTISKFSNKTYNIKFKGIDDNAFITQKNLKILTERISVV